MPGGAPAGNSNARNPKKFQEALRRALARRANGDLNAGLDTVAMKLVDAASEGEQWAVKEIADRLDGKPAQAIVGDDDFPPVRLEGGIKLIKP